MDYTDNKNRLWILSMMTMGCVGGANEPADTESTGMTSGTTTVASADDTTGGPSSGTAADDSTTDAATTDLSTTGEASTEGSSGSSDSSSGDSSSESSGSSTTGVDVSPFVEACAASYTSYSDCYRPKYSYTEEEVLAQCAAYEDYVAGYGEGCVEARTDYFACLSELDCKELESGCSKALIAGNAACPELFGFCSGSGGGGGPDDCALLASDCLDGSEYRVDCDATTCICSVNDVPGATFPSLGVEACFDEDFGDTAVTECGFPEGIFF